MNKFRVAMIEPVGGHGGMNYYDYSLAKGLEKLGVEVLWFTCDETMEKSSELVRVLKLFRGIYGTQPAIIRGIRYVKGLITTLFACKCESVELAHLHFFHFGMMELVTVLLLKFFQLRVVLTVHDVQSFIGGSGGWKKGFILKFIDGFVVHNNVSYEELVKMLNLHDIKEKKIEIIRHGNYQSNVSFMDKRKARELLEVGGGQIVLFFGQIKDVKGLDVLLKAVSKLSNEANIKVLIAGKVWHADFSKYQAIINDLDIEDRLIKRIQYIPDEKVNAYYCSADLVVLPYRRIYQSGVLLMAMSYGVPVLVSDLPGMTEIVTHNKNGFVFKSEDHIDLARKIEIALADNVKLKECSNAALRLMESEYSWSEIAKLTLEFYISVVQ